MDESTAKNLLAQKAPVPSHRVLNRSDALSAIRSAVALDGRPCNGTLVIGREIRFAGQIRSCRDLVVSGHIEAEVETERLEIAEGGSLCGRAVAEIAEIGGRFKGDLTVHDELRLGPKARVEGRIRYRRVSIRSGGTLVGEISLLAAD